MGETLMSTKAWIGAAALAATSIAQATCYSVYKSDGTLIHQTSTPPVNLSLPLSDTVPEKYGAGATMQLSDVGIYCKDQRGSNTANQPGAPAATQAAAQAEPGVVKQLAGSTGPLGGLAPR